MRHLTKKENTRKKIIAILSVLLVILVSLTAISSLASTGDNQNLLGEAKKTAPASMVTENNTTPVESPEKPTEELNLLKTDTDFWEVKLAGETVGIFVSEEEANSLIDIIKAKFAEEGALSVELEPAMRVGKLSKAKGDKAPELVNDVKALASKLLEGSIQEIEVEVQDGDTLWTIASSKGISVEDILAANPGLDEDSLQPGDKLVIKEGRPDVAVKVVTTVVEEEAVPFDVVYEDTDELYEDEESVYIEGEEGIKTVSYQLTKVNGAVIDRTAVSEEVIAEPVNRVILVGTLERPVAEEESENIEESYEAESAEESTAETSEESSEGTASSSGGGVSANKQAIVDAALAQIGVHQDCTMLVTNSLRAVGIDFHSGPQGYTSLGTWTDNPEPGDICIYTTHVAIYIGNGQAVHGGWYGYTTEVWSVYTSWPKFIGYIHLDL